jgi:hypothetical protein
MFGRLRRFQAQRGSCLGRARDGRVFERRFVVAHEAQGPAHRRERRKTNVSHEPQSADDEDRRSDHAEDDEETRAKEGRTDHDDQGSECGEGQTPVQRDAWVARLPRGRSRTDR